MKHGIWIPNEILAKEATLIAKVIWADIHSLASNDGSYYKTNQTIANEFMVSVSSVTRAIKELQDLGLVSVVSFNGRKRILEILPSQIDESASSNRPSRVVKKKKQPRQIEQAASSNRPTENTIKKTEEKTVEVILPFDSEDFLEIWTTWIDERKQRKYKKYTPRGEQGQLHRLQKISNNDESTAIEIIKESIAQGYQGLFPLKNGNRIKQNITINGINDFITNG